MEESFSYTKHLNDKGLPCVVEAAFGYRGEDCEQDRRLFSGANWSAAIKNPFRSFGSTGEGLERELTEAYVKGDEPVIFAIHLACPRVEYADRGKSSLIVATSRDEEE
jgi:hypothetical protein